MNLIGPVTSSGAKTASAQIATMPGFFHSVIINPPSSGLLTVEIWDSEDSSTAGKLSLGRFTCAAGQNNLHFVSVIPMVANRGIYAQLITGTGTFVVGYSI